MNNDELEKIKEYTDAEILDMLSQPNNFDEAAIEAAKIVANERYLKNEKINQSTINRARYLLEQNIPINEVVDKLVEANINLEEAEKAVFEASKVADFELAKKRKKERQKEESGMSLWWVLFVIFIIIRWIIRLAQN